MTNSNNMKGPSKRSSKLHLHHGIFLYATQVVLVAYFAIRHSSINNNSCHAFIRSPAAHHHFLAHRHRHTAIERKKADRHTRPLFRELISDDEEDLRADIVTIQKQEGLDDFLKVDNRLCVIKLFAPYCKACRSFGVKFRKLATDRGDRLNAAGKIVHTGDARFGELDYASNIKLVKNLGVKKFPTVLIFRGGGVDGSSSRSGGKLSEIVCKQTAIEDIVAAMDQWISSPIES